MRDLKTEQYLKRGSYSFQFVEGYDLTRINLQAEAQNPARLARNKDEDRIIKMAVSMLDGVDFPAIVVFQNDGPRDDLVTGYHRGCAYDDAGIKTCDAYVVVEHDPYRRALLPRAINSIEGRSSTAAEDLAQVAELLRLFPDASQHDLAIAFSLKQPAISDYLKLIEQEARAKALGCGEIWGRITQIGLRKQLGRITNDNVFVMAIETIDQLRLVGKPAEDLIHAAQKAKTEAAAGKVLQDALRAHIEAQERAQAKYGKRAKKGVGDRWFAALRRLWRTVPVWDLKKLHLDAFEPSAIGMNLLQLKEVRQQIDDVIADQERRLQQYEQEQAWRKAGAPTSVDISRDNRAKS